MKILVAIPVYDSKLFCRTVNCLMSEQYIALKFGHELSVEFMPNCSIPSMGRSVLAHSFMESDFDKLIFLDSDVTFDPCALVKLAAHDADYVGGSYRFKCDEEKYPVTFLPKPYLETDKPGLIEVAVTPGGFLCLSRKVFEVAKKRFPERTQTHFGNTFHAYFSTPFAGGLTSEEAFFANEWRESGGKVYLLPDLNITHWNFDPVPFVGNIGNWIQSKLAPTTEEMKKQYLKEKQSEVSNG